MISIKERLPSDERYRIVMLDDGMHICKYVESKSTWIDRENWYRNKVTHWIPLPDEIIE